MVSLSVFIGQLISDIANARTHADYSASSVSEQYHADPFVKNLPIPHYTIDEAEIEVPVMVVGITKQSEEFVMQKANLLKSINEKLLIYLLRSYKYNFVREREKINEEKENKEKNDEKIRTETGKQLNSRPQKRTNTVNYEFSEIVLDAFAESAKNITEKMVKNVESYMDNYNYEIIKILELTDDFKKQLFREMRMDIKTYPEEEKPYYSEESIRKSIDFIGKLMFFEFKKIMHSSAGVDIDIQTTQMNEYATKDCLMHIKLKIKEQDLTLIVEENANNKDKRYLSLT